VQNLSWEIDLGLKGFAKWPLVASVQTKRSTVFAHDKLSSGWRQTVNNSVARIVSEKRPKYSKNQSHLGKNMNIAYFIFQIVLRCRKKKIAYSVLILVSLGYEIFPNREISPILVTLANNKKPLRVLIPSIRWQIAEA
jgi:hypothetical protein